MANDSEGQEIRKVTDDGFVLIEQEVSPNRQYFSLSYHYDTGAFGYSRVWWAIVPKQFQGLNLAEFELPDGYKIVGWDEESSDLLLVKWKPYYFKKEDVSLSTGDQLYGVRIRVVGPLGHP